MKVIAEQRKIGFELSRQNFDMNSHTPSGGCVEVKFVKPSSHGQVEPARSLELVDESCQVIVADSCYIRLRN